MKYILSTGIILTFAILFTASSGVLKTEAYPDYKQIEVMKNMNMNMKKIILYQQMTGMKFQHCLSK